MHQRRLDTQIIRRFKKSGDRDTRKSKQTAYNRRINLAVLSRIKKSRDFALIVDEMDFSSIVKEVGKIIEPEVRFM